MRKFKGLMMATLLAVIATQANATVHKASYYGKFFHGKRTANGEIYNMYGLTTASNSHKMGTKLKVTNVANGKSVIVKVNDTGGFKKYGRTLDLSFGAFKTIADPRQGIVNVRIEVVK